MAANSRHSVLYAYRNLLRAQSKLFREDVRTLQAARKETRERFLHHKEDISADKLKSHISLANQVTALLKERVLQGVSVGNENVFKLRITKDTVLGDNDSIKNSKNSKRPSNQSSAESCCGHSH
ncbi:hypothetical protein BDF14DRAFT_1878340 [Spinellus fusiger]|nr:hypothetical protein BDF14DRAFT_1887362 [Spinellus fusiger]KAI7871487.1 hypothetical protein BDF14DRAFT_1878340 [Spinellus fusiger]